MTKPTTEELLQWVEKREQNENSVYASMLGTKDKHDLSEKDFQPITDLHDKEMHIMSAIRERLLATQWLDIKDAPRDGTHIWLSDGFSMRIGYWADGEQFECHGSVGGGWLDFNSVEAGNRLRGLKFAPTHYMPLPQLPEDNQ